MDSGRYIKALLEAAEEMKLPCDEVLAQRLAAHQVLVDKWAQRINLTTVTEPAEAAVKHGLDCLLFASVLSDDSDETTVDIGSGGGFPGIIIAVAQPARRMVLLEPIRKRASFLRTAAASLGLKNVRVVEGRLEAGQPAKGIEWPVPCIVSRATIPPLQLVPLAAPFLQPGGALVLTAGGGAPSVPDLEAVAQGTGLTHTSRASFSLPGGMSRVLDRFTLG